MIGPNNKITRGTFSWICATGVNCNSLYPYIYDDTDMQLDIVLYRYRYLD